MFIIVACLKGKVANYLCKKLHEELMSHGIEHGFRRYSQCDVEIRCDEKVIRFIRASSDKYIGLRPDFYYTDSSCAKGYLKHTGAKEITFSETIKLMTGEINDIQREISTGASIKY